MKTALLMLAAAVIGYRLPPLVERLRNIVRQRTFTPILLRPYDPVVDEAAVPASPTKAAHEE